MTPHPATSNADELQRLYRQKRLAWARAIGLPVSRHKGQKPDPGALDDELPDEG